MWKKDVEKRQRLIVEAVQRMDILEISRLQIGRIRSLAGRTVAVIAVADNEGGMTPGVDGETWHVEHIIHTMRGRGR